MPRKTCTEKLWKTGRLSNYRLSASRFCLWEGIGVSSRSRGSRLCQKPALLNLEREWLSSNGKIKLSHSDLLALMAARLDLHGDRRSETRCSNRTRHSTGYTASIRSKRGNLVTYRYKRPLQRSVAITRARIKSSPPRKILSSNLMIFCQRYKLDRSLRSSI